MLEELQQAGYQILVRQHAEAILSYDIPEALGEIAQALLPLTIPMSELIASGGGEAKSTQRLRRQFSELGWPKTNFEIKKIVNNIEKESISHEIDHVKGFDRGSIALEIEWNNKDPFFDRDLENFQRLHNEGAISVGCIITRGRQLHESMRELTLDFLDRHQISNLEELLPYGYNPTAKQRQRIRSRENHGDAFVQAFTKIFVSDKFGEATTHWRKLEDRVRRGVGNPCPLLLIGIPRSVVQID